jgi:hypothetical protein
VSKFLLFAAVYWYAESGGSNPGNLRTAIAERQQHIQDKEDRIAWLNGTGVRARVESLGGLGLPEGIKDLAEAAERTT